MQIKVPGRSSILTGGSAPPEMLIFVTFLRPRLRRYCSAVVVDVVGVLKAYCLQNLWVTKCCSARDYFLCQCATMVTRPCRLISRIVCSIRALYGFASSQFTGKQTAGFFLFLFFGETKIGASLACRPLPWEKSLFRIRSAQKMGKNRNFWVLNLLLFNLFPKNKLAA